MSSMKVSVLGFRYALFHSKLRHFLNAPLRDWIYALLKIKTIGYMKNPTHISKILRGISDKSLKMD